MVAATVSTAVPTAVAAAVPTAAVVAVVITAVPTAVAANVATVVAAVVATCYLITQTALVFQAHFKDLHCANIKKVNSLIYRCTRLDLSLYQLC